MRVSNFRTTNAVVPTTPVKANQPAGHPGQ